MSDHKFTDIYSRSISSGRDNVQFACAFMTWLAGNRAALKYFLVGGIILLLAGAALRLVVRFPDTQEHLSWFIIRNIDYAELPSWQPLDIKHTVLEGFSEDPGKVFEAALLEADTVMTRSETDCGCRKITLDIMLLEFAFADDRARFVFDIQPQSISLSDAAIIRMTL